MEFIIESKSPVCDVMAGVTKEKDCYYFYIIEHPDTEPKLSHALWICNRTKAPEALNVEAMAQGNPPAMPARFVNDTHNPDGEELNPEDLQIIWYETGSCAALFCKGKLLCAVPPYAGVDIFPGFSRFAKGQARYAWELPENSSPVEERAAAAGAFWSYILQPNSWDKIRAGHRSCIEDFFHGKHESYFEINKGGFPHRAVMTGRKRDVIYNITMGYSQFPMPLAEINYAAKTGEYCRMELGFATVEGNRELSTKMLPVMAKIGALPWEEISVMAHGHVVDTDIIEGFSAFLLVNPNYVLPLEGPTYPPFFNCRVNLLWMIPITEREKNVLRDKGISDLLKRCNEPKRMHIFDGNPKF